MLDWMALDRRSDSSIGLAGLPGHVALDLGDRPHRVDRLCRRQRARFDQRVQCASGSISAA